MTARYQRELKKAMQERCTELGISVPANATKRQLKAALESYYNLNSRLNCNYKTVKRRK